MLVITLDRIYGLLHGEWPGAYISMVLLVLEHGQFAGQGGGMVELRAIDHGEKKLCAITEAVSIIK